MKNIFTLTLFFFLAPIAQADDSLYSKFFGKFSGQVEVSGDRIRNLEVEIKPIEKGFNVGWKTITSDQSGSGKTKSYSINFVVSDRHGIYGSAMKTNLFGGQEALDPMKGEPYFWSKITDQTLTIFGMLITEDGNYEIQRYDRTLKGDDMQLVYTLSKEDEIVKNISASLTKNN